MKDNQHLNPDAIYAAMAWLREYVENPQGKEAFGTRLDEIEEIFFGEPVSITVGIELARNLIWGPPNFSTAILQGKHSEDAPIREAMSRFIAGRAN